VTCCAALRGGKGSVAVALEEGFMVIWDREMEVKQAMIKMDNVMAEDGSEQIIVMGRNHSFYKIDCQSGRIVGEYSSEKTSGVHFLPDFQLLRPHELLTGQYIGYVSFLTVNSLTPFMK
jgi:hypothetical protein